MRIIHDMEGDVKIHIEDTDDYVCTEDNGVSFYPTPVQVREIVETLKGDIE